MPRFLPSSQTARRVARALLCLSLFGLNACDSSSKDGDQSSGTGRSASPGPSGDNTANKSSGDSEGAMAVSGMNAGSFGNTGGALPTMPASSGGAAGGSAGSADPAGTSDEPGDGEATDAGIDLEVKNAIAAGQLTAGEWNDLAHWDFWTALRGDCGDDQDCPETLAQEAAVAWKLDTSGLIPVVVKAGGDPVVDAQVTLRDKDQKVVWQAHTDHAGQAALFVDMFEKGSHAPYSVEVKAGDDSTSKDDVAVDAAHPLELSLPAAHAPAHSLDLMFVVDTTGSMGDELRYLQSELEDVIKNVRDHVGQQLALRTSVNFYRDHADEYVVRPFAFTTDVSASLEELAEQSADGGGDLPEAADEALDDAIANHDWSANASARLLFLVLDAPPHRTGETIARIHGATRAAAEAGVQLIPVVASGANKPTEFLLRSLAVATGGTYTFLTDDSGIGNSHLKPTIGKYDVELLNDLLVRVISERL
jgi:hypothetical protein